MQIKINSSAETIKLGELVSALEQANPASSVRFDLGFIYPDDIASWRGRYNELALGYRTSTQVPVHEKGTSTVANLINLLKSANGAIFVGWKGGDFKMDLDTPVWVDNPGEYSNTTIRGIIYDPEYAGEVIIITKTREI